MDIRGANVTLHIGGDVPGGLDGLNEAAAAALAARLHVDVIVHGDDPAIETLLAGANVTVRVETASSSAMKEPDGEAGGPVGGETVGVDTDAFRTAVISMDTTSTDAETRFRTAIVALDGIAGNQVDGISPLYHVSRFDRPDAMAAVIQITTRLDARTLIAALGDVEAAVGGGLDLDLIDMPGVHADAPDCRVPWPSARTCAAVLAPWLDMDPDARLDGDPVSFLLAMAPDAGQVGMLSDNWIIGGAL